MQYEEYRRNYVRGGLSREEMAADPLEQFDRWQQQAIEAGLADPTAASLATVDLSSNLWQRIVLLKAVANGGFVFFTNYHSNKGRALMSDSRASMLFPWNELDRQVTVSGRVEAIPSEESDRYFSSRPRESQLGAWASQQSEPIASRRALLKKFEEAKEGFADRDVERPPHWGGFRLMPRQIEFWQGGEHRLHDRLRYTLNDDDWILERLQP
ncbi:pyridoxamine 5'-phosphate oxidase [Luminiphilus syltensis NOR5-1B]|uniref:Pyridoxine/pyridoxamine 5'-phosphate oxidase n=1 Tax=Luminiphilus syltensis NOR5-1B TaxID=565045 RepID=B8KW47_9GAMM|nr:pyridoxamine 5'-phosphate oxidase [Luminiphilus syltensis]EED34288.1 pyridoxamine 5'-phosphate oxidase [Luminiphilus syltensis NOR5-1B]